MYLGIRETVSFENWWHQAHQHPETEPIHHGVGLAVLRQDTIPLTSEQIEIAEEMVRLEILGRGEKPGTYTLVVSHIGTAKPRSAVDELSSSYWGLPHYTRRGRKFLSTAQLGFEFRDWITPRATLG